MKDEFSAEVTQELMQRIDALTPPTQPTWGKMSVSLMLAHVCVAYERAFENKHPKYNAIMRFTLLTFV